MATQGVCHAKEKVTYMFFNGDIVFHLLLARQVTRFTCYKNSMQQLRSIHVAIIIFGASLSEPHTGQTASPAMFICEASMTTRAAQKRLVIIIIRIAVKPSPNFNPFLALHGCEYHYRCIIRSRYTCYMCTTQNHS